MNEPQVRIGIVGAGIRGSLFAEALGQHPLVEVVGIADVNFATAEASGSRLRIPAFGSHDELLALPAIDALVIATPDFAHRDVAVAAALAGKHLLIEKPLATNIDDAREIAEAAKKGGARVMVGFENRWNPRFISAKESMASELGTVHNQIAHLNDTRWVPLQMIRWSAKSSPAWFLMPHTLDLLLWMSGKKVRSVFSSGVKKVLVAEGVDTWDSIDAMLEFTDGSTATLHSSWVLPESFPAVYDLRYEAVGSTGAIRVNGSDQGVHLFSDRASWPQWGTYRIDGRFIGFPIDMAFAFAEFVRGSDIDVPGLEDGLIVTEVIAAIHESLESRAPVAVRSSQRGGA